MADLVAAAGRNDLDSLRRLLDKELVDHPNLSNETKKSTTAMDSALHAAAHYDHPEAVNMLIDSGCDLDWDEGTLDDDDDDDGDASLFPVTSMPQRQTDFSPVPRHRSDTRRREIQGCDRRSHRSRLVHQYYHSVRIVNC